MHPAIYRQYRDILRTFDFGGKAILEVGAVPDKRSLLNLDVLRSASERVGIDLGGHHLCENFEILKGNANDMSGFDSGRFDLVLCNAVLEHDPYFWKSVGEMKRVVRPGGLLVLGVPGYVDRPVGRYIRRALARTPVVGKATYRWFNILITSTLTFHVHDAPGDYYRFSEQAVREVLLGGLTDVRTWYVMFPPRLIGIGRKPI